jgi:hypothetical protein
MKLADTKAGDYLAPYYVYDNTLKGDSGLTSSSKSGTRLIGPKVMINARIG